MTKLFKYLKPYLPMMLAIIVLVAGSCLADLTLPDLMSQIIDGGVLKGDVAYIRDVGLKMLLVAFLGMAATITVSFLASRTGAGFGRDLRSAVFTKVSGFSVAQFDTFSTASLITRSTNDIQQVSMFTVMFLRVAVSAPITLIGGIIKGNAKSSELSWILAVAMPVIALAVLLIVRASTRLFKLMQKQLDKLNRVLREGLTGVRVIRAFDRDELQGERFEAANRELTDTARKAHRIMSTLMPVMTLVMSMTQLAIVWFSGAKIDSGSMTLGGMMAFIQYAVQILASLMMFGFIFMMWPRAAASSSRVREVLESENTIAEPENPVCPPANGEIVFENVGFSYPGAEKPTLHDISFTAKKGETVAIIGGTGSGKSTIASLLLRFFDVSEGRILIDGEDIRDIGSAGVRSRIGYVPQTAQLLTGTVMENISLGKPGLDREQAQQAAQTAQAWGFISRREGGLDAEIAQSGTNLSGGQKQRLSIARAVAKNPEFYIFDDSFSALDFKTDANLRAALAQNTYGATVIVIAQRINTIMNADRILVINEGRIAGSGTHSQLMQSCEIYREIASSQLAKEAL